MLIIVPQDLRRLVFDDYHASSVGGHLGINKTLVVLRLSFLWPDMRKDIIAWVRACAVCIQVKSTTFTSTQLVHLPVITSVNVWSPGEVTSHTGAKCIRNCMCHMTQFIVSVWLSHVNSAELSRDFMESVLLNVGLCVVVVVDDDTKCMVLFEGTCKSLNIRFHCAAKHNLKTVGVKYFHKFLNHKGRIIITTCQTYQCFVDLALISMIRRVPTYTCVD